MNRSPRPAERLAGLQLQRGWQVEALIPRSTSATGGMFSVSYKVLSNRGERAFLKALDYSEALQSPDPARALQALTESYNFERDMLARCRGMHGIVRAIDDGAVVVDQSPVGTVQYIIFELADCDIRIFLAAMDTIDIAWQLRTLHRVSSALQELHAAEIAHQDLKPSNILLFGDQPRIADFGRASHLRIPGPHDGFPIAGQRAYAPPELLYNHLDPDVKIRRLGTDLYLLGSMMVFFSTQLSMSALLLKHLLPQFHPGRWRDTFDRCLPYLYDAYAAALGEFETTVQPLELASNLVEMVSQLCDPDPRERGVTRRAARGASRLSLDRFVSRLNLLAIQTESGIFRSMA